MTQIKIGKFNVTVTSNKPSEEAAKNCNRIVNEIMRKKTS